MAQLWRVFQRWLWGGWWFSSLPSLSYSPTQALGRVSLRTVTVSSSYKGHLGSMVPTSKKRYPVPRARCAATFSSQGTLSWSKRGLSPTLVYVREAGQLAQLQSFGVRTSNLPPHLQPFFPLPSTTLHPLRHIYPQLDPRATDLGPELGTRNKQVLAFVSALDLLLTLRELVSLLLQAILAPQADLPTSNLGPFPCCLLAIHTHSNHFALE